VGEEALQEKPELEENKRKFEETVSIPKRLRRNDARGDHHLGTSIPVEQVSSQKKSRSAHPRAGAALVTLSGERLSPQDGREFDADGGRQASGWYGESRVRVWPLHPILGPRADAWLDYHNHARQHRHEDPRCSTTRCSISGCFGVSASSGASSDT